MKEILMNDGAYEVLWMVVDFLEEDWPSSPVGQMASDAVHERMKQAANEIKVTAHLMLWGVGD